MSCLFDNIVFSVNIKKLLLVVEIAQHRVVDCAKAFNEMNLVQQKKTGNTI